LRREFDIELNIQEIRIRDLTICKLKSRKIQDNRLTAKKTKHLKFETFRCKIIVKFVIRIFERRKIWENDIYCYILLH